MKQGFSRAGATLCAVYAAIIGICLLAGYFASDDPKSRFVFFQLPIAVQGGLLQEIGFGPVLERLNWVLAYLVLGGGTFVTLYLVGAAIERKVAK